VPTYSQANGPFAIKTPLGEDVLLLTGFRVRESISQLFQADADLLAPIANEIAFDRILGQSVTVEMRLVNGDKRYFNGIVNRFTQRAHDETFSCFRAEIVPKLWLLTKKIRSRIFQHLTVPDILREVLSELEVVYNIHGTYGPREYCVQYRESDFQFVSRLMEEEGIYYFFTHTDGTHRLVLTDLSNLHPVASGQSRIPYDEAATHQQKDMSIWSWEKTQELRAGKYTVWDHWFQIPSSNFEAKEHTIGNIAVGKVNHKLTVGGNDQLEIYEYPGGYAHRFDGIDRSGQPKPERLQTLLREGQRTVTVRMEQEEVAAIEIRGVCNCPNFVPGHKFTFEHHFDGDGEYLLTSAEHQGRLGDNYAKGDETDFHYETHFTCIPAALSYRPQRQTPKPVIAGTQTATVVGSPGEEIFCDKYGRVKVQFHWDREGKKNADSSCWLRVAQVWAGKGWGAFFWPRIGHEVVVSFEEGDPDRPLIIGSVYNEENMPWYSLPINKQLAGIKSASVRGRAHQNFNGIVFNDQKGHEHLAIHSERNLTLNSEADKMIQSGRHKGERVAVANVLTVGKLIPSGGGSGGGFDEGNPMPNPPPTGVVGLNAVFTFGDAFQAACPFNQQLVIGNNLQMCINPFGLAAGAPGLSFPQYMQVLCGGGMGGSMQFTVGSSAQFTLGQTYEISIGPPKIEIHAPYRDHLPISILCGVLSAASIAFMIIYETRHGPYEPNPAGSAPAPPDEESGDKERVNWVVAYQLLMDVGLTVIMMLEAITDSMDWLADKVMSTLYEVDGSCLNKLGIPGAQGDPKESSWGDIWEVTVGAAGITAAVEASVVMAANE
jgi:type VI secretion system secreted protein VgrG